MLTLSQYIILLYDYWCTIQDTAGQERYRAITTAYYRGAMGALLVYDATRESTLDSIPRWFHELREHTHPNVQILLLGNKCDVNDDEKQVNIESAESIADELHIPVTETSAKTGLNVEKAFIQIVQQIYNNKTLLQSQQQQNSSQRHGHNQSHNVSNTVQLHNTHGEESKFDEFKSKCCTQ